MNTSKLADVAEIIAAVGVILSLLFVGFQIKDGNNETRAATLQSALNSEMDMISTIVWHTSTWDKVMTGAPLDSGEEMRKGIALYNLLMTERENRYYQFKSGYFDARIWEASVTSLRQMVILPIFGIWRNTPGALNHSADFLALLDSLREG
jgi:hypothetical protein